MLSHHPYQQRRLTRGSFAMEVAVAIVVLTVGIAFALPRYNNYVRRLHRSAAKDALLQMGTMEEQYFNLHGIYSASPSDLGYSNSKIPFTIANGAYAITELRTMSGGGDQPAKHETVAYSITATAIGTDDSKCQTFTITSAGVQSSTGTPRGTDCWH